MCARFVRVYVCVRACTLVLIESVLHKPKVAFTNTKPKHLKQYARDLPCFCGLEKFSNARRKFRQNAEGREVVAVPQRPLSDVVWADTFKYTNVFKNLTRPPPSNCPSPCLHYRRPVCLLSPDGLLCGRKGRVCKRKACLLAPTNPKSSVTIADE